MNLCNKSLKPIVDGKNLRKYGIKHDNKYLIFPYTHTQGNGSFNVISENKMRNSYPNIYKHLLRYKENLAKRSDIIKSKSKWYELRPCTYYNIFDEEKIFVPDIAQENKFSYDDEGFFCFHTIYVILPKREYKKIIKYFLGILNSRLVEYYFRQIGGYLGKSGYRYQKQYLERIPIKLPQTKKEHELADKIISKVEKIISQVEIEQRIEKFPEPYIEEHKDKEWKEIPIKFNATYKSLEPSITESVDESGFSVILSRMEEPIFVETKTKANYLVTTLKGNKVKKEEKVKIPIPRDNTIVRDILNSYNKDKNQLEKLPISKLEDVINKLVYELYGLNDEDKKVIEKFLEKN